MSIQQESFGLKSAQAALEEELKYVTSALVNLCNSRMLLDQKVDCLKVGVSPLSNTLLEEAQKELDVLNQELSCLLSQKAQLEKALNDN